MVRMLYRGNIFTVIPVFQILPCLRCHRPGMFCQCLTPIMELRVRQYKTGRNLGAILHCNAVYGISIAQLYAEVQDCPSWIYEDYNTNFTDHSPP